MDATPDTDLQALGQGLLTLYEHALRLGQFDAAEHLLRALEDVARIAPACCAMRDQAYLLIEGFDVDALRDAASER